MSANTPGNIPESIKEQIGKQQAFWMSMADKSFESAAKLAELNLKLGQDTLEDALSMGRKILSSEAPKELLMPDQERIQANFKRIFAYSGEVAKIAAAMQAEFNNTAREFDGGASMRTSNASGKAGNGAANPFEAMKTAMENVGSGFEQWVAMSKQFADAVADNAHAASQVIDVTPKKSGKSTGKVGA